MFIWIEYLLQEERYESLWLCANVFLQRNDSMNAVYSCMADSPMGSLSLLIAIRGLILQSNGSLIILAEPRQKNAKAKL